MHCNENSNFVFPEKELCGLNPNFHIHVFVSDLYIPRIGPHIFLQQNIFFSGNICFAFSVLSFFSVAHGLIPGAQACTLNNEALASLRELNHVGVIAIWKTPNKNYVHPSISTSRQTSLVRDLNLRPPATQAGALP